MAHRKKQHHSVGLGNYFLTRARVVFIFSIILGGLLLGSAIYNSNKTGAIQKNIIEPVKKAAVLFFEYASEEPNAPIPTSFLDNGTIRNTVIINSETGSITPTPKQTNSYYESSYENYYQSTYAPSKSFEEIVSENNKWFEEKKAENEKWFQEKSAANKSNYDEAVKKMNEDYNADVQKMNDDLDAWKKEHGF